MVLVTERSTHCIGVKLLTSLYFMAFFYFGHNGFNSRLLLKYWIVLELETLNITSNRNNR